MQLNVTDEDVSNPNVKKFRDFLGQAEGANYDTIVGGSTFKDFSKHPNIVGLRTADGASTAAGRYQITQRTYKDIAPQLGITDFSPESQDKLATALLQRRGALEDVKQGNFMDAIGKLGQEWASLPSSTYKQGKRSLQWAQQELGMQTDPQPNPMWATVQGQSPNIGGNNPSVNAQLEAERAARHDGVFNTARDFLSSIGDGFRLDNSVYNYLKTKGLEHVDQGYSPDHDDGLQKALESIPEKHWDYVLQAQSAEERDARLERVKQQLGIEQQLGERGWAGVLGRMAGGTALDPLMWASVLAPELGGASLLSRASRVQNMLRMGLIQGGTNAAYESVVGKYKPLATSEDIYSAGMMGLAMGAAFGGALNPKHLPVSRFSSEYKEMQQAGMRGSVKTHIEELNSIPLTPEGEAYKTYLQNYGKGAWRETVDAEAEQLMKSIRNEGEAIRKQYLPPEEKYGVPINAPGREPVKAPEGVPLANLRTQEPAPKQTLWGQAASREIETKAGPLASTTASAELDRLISSTDPHIAALARGLKENLVTDLPVYRITKADMRSNSKEANVLGYYSMEKHHVALNPDAGDSTLLHEIAHSQTAYKLRYGFNNPDTAHGQLAKEFNGLYEEALEAAKLTKFQSYYLKNVDEFMAGLYGGAKADSFHAFLQSVQSAGEAGGSLLSRMANTIKKLLGLTDEESNLWLKSLDLSDRIQKEHLDTRIANPHNRGYTVKQDLLYDEAHVPPGTDAETPQALNKAHVPAVYGRSLALEHSLGGKSASDGERWLSSKLFGTTVGYVDHSVVTPHVMESMQQLFGGWSTEVRKATIPAFNEEFKLSGRPRGEKGQAWEQFGEQVSNYIRGFDGEYSPHVQKVGNTIRGKLNEIREYINNPLFAEKGKKRGLTETEVKDLQTGLTKIVGTLEENPNYLPRRADVTKWQNVVKQYGQQFVEDFWAGAFKSGRDGITDEAAKRFGKWYAKAVNDSLADRSHDLLGELLQGTDKEALKTSLIDKGGFTPMEADELIQHMIPVRDSDAGRTSASLKHRALLDEKYTMRVAKDGATETVSINDFINTNAMEVFEQYARRTASSVALAKHLDIYKVGDISRIIHDATTIDMATSPAERTRLLNSRKKLQFAFDRIQGIPMEEFSWWGKSLQMWRDFNVIRLMGGSVWNQATEAAQIVGSMGWKTMLAAMPELKALRREIATGKAPHDILEHLENTIGGAGGEYVERMEFKPSDDWVRHKGDTKMNRWLDQLDTGIKKFARGTLDYTGMTPLMIQQKRVHAVALVNHFVKAAQDGGSEFLSKNRLAWMGMSEEDAGRLYAALKTHSSPTKGEFSNTFKLDIKAFQQVSPQEHANLMTAIHRETRRVIQENDLASMIPIMGTTLAKTVFQFQSFGIHGWNKSLQFAMNHRDWATTSTVLHGALFAGLAYMGRTLLDSQGMDPMKQQDFLDKRLSLKQVVANSVGRVPQASMLPQIYDTLSPFPMFSGMRTTSDLSSFAANPTLQGINTLISVKKAITNALDDTKQTTEQDVRQWAKLAPWNNVAPISTLLNSIVSDYPRSDVER